MTRPQATQRDSLRESAERLSSVCSLRPFTPEEAEEAVNTLLAIPALLADRDRAGRRAAALRRILGLLAHRRWWNSNVWAAMEIAKEALVDA